MKARHLITLVALATSLLTLAGCGAKEDDAVVVPPDKPGAAGGPPQGGMAGAPGGAAPTKAGTPGTMDTGPG